jgi:hypothetical protein
MRAARLLRDDRRCAERHRLLLALIDDLLKRLDIHPQPAASRALTQTRAPDRDRLHLKATTRAVPPRCLNSRFRALGLRSTARTMTTADEHHGKATRARNCRKPRVAELATHCIGRSGSATRRTVERFGVHRFRSLRETGF